MQIRSLMKCNKAKDAMNDTAELKNPLHIGTIESLCTVKLQEIVQRFRKEHPQVRIQITIGSPERLIQKMEHNELDVILYSGHTKME